MPDVLQPRPHLTSIRTSRGDGVASVITNVRRGSPWLLSFLHYWDGSFDRPGARFQRLTKVNGPLSAWLTEHEMAVREIDRVIAEEAS